MVSVFVETLTIETVIGIFDWERDIRQAVSLDLEMDFDIRQAAASDSIEDTLDYKAVAKRLIQEHFGVFYSVRYISELLKSLGYSYQKARFVSDHLNPAAREQWLNSRWPEILELARRKNAYLLFGDEASFPQWGTLTYTWAKKGQHTRTGSGLPLHRGARGAKLR